MVKEFNGSERHSSPSSRKGSSASPQDKEEIKNLEKWFEIEGFTELLKVEQDDTFFS